MPALSESTTLAIRQIISPGNLNSLNNHVVIIVTVIAITALIAVAYLFWRRFAKNSVQVAPPQVTRPGIRKFPQEKPKPRFGPTVPVPAITVTMHETDISRSVTVPSLDFAFLAEYASDAEKAAKEEKRGLGKGLRGAFFASASGALCRLRSSISRVSTRLDGKPQIIRKPEPSEPSPAYDYSFSSNDCTVGRN